MTNKKSIPNPNRLTAEEKQFLHAQPSNIAAKTHVTASKPGYKNIMVSMPHDFLSTLDNYLKNIPTEGSRSSLIVRVVAEYLRSKANLY